MRAKKQSYRKRKNIRQFRYILIGPVLKRNDLLFFTRFEILRAVNMETRLEFGNVCLVAWYIGMNVLDRSVSPHFLGSIYLLIRIDNRPLSGPSSLLCFPLSCFMSSVPFITYDLSPRDLLFWRIDGSSSSLPNFNTTHPKI